MKTTKLILIISLFYFSVMAQNKTQVYVIKDVNIISMTLTNAILNNANIVINGNRIESINGLIPKNTKIIDGKGKWLIPGLIDMHVHIPTDGHFGPPKPTQGATFFFDLQDYMTLNIANGVTTLFDLGSRVEHFGQRNEIAKGKVIGSRMALSARINGGKGREMRANTPDEGRQAVRIAKAEGYEFIKLYSDLNLETYLAIIDEAKIQNLKTVGHIPDAFEGKLQEAFVPHFGMVAHAEELAKHCINYSEEEAKHFAQLLKENGTWLTPTLTTMVWITKQVRSLDEVRNSPYLQYMHPLLQSKWLTANNYNKMSSPENIALFENFVKFHKLLVKECKAAGVPMVVGTDASTSGVIDGFAVHDELTLMVDAGLTPEEVLMSATRLPATWLGIDNEVGTVEVGKLADLILLNANPLENIQNTRKIAGVFVNGNWLDKNKIQTNLTDLSKRNIARKNQFDWKTIISGKKK